MTYGEYIFKATCQADDREATARGWDELVRCNDCKYCRTYYHGENMPFSYACAKLYLTNNLSSDDYCSRGVRREE